MGRFFTRSKSSAEMYTCGVAIADMNPPYYDVSYAGRLVFEQSPGESAPGGGV